MGVGTELWTRDTGDLAPLLPRADEWEEDEGLFEFADDDERFLLTVAAPEEADPAEADPALTQLEPGVRYRIGIELEPSAPEGAEAWTLLLETMESLGRALGGVGLDPDTGHARHFGR